MPSRKSAPAAVQAKIHARVDISRLLPPSVPMDAALKKQLTSGLRSIDQLSKELTRLSDKIKSLVGQDKLGNFEIQDLMVGFNQAEQLASNVLKSANDTANAVIGKV